MFVLDEVPRKGWKMFAKNIGESVNWCGGQEEGV